MPPPAPALGVVPPAQTRAQLIFSPTEASAAGSVGASLVVVVVVAEVVRQVEVVVRQAVLVGLVVFVRHRPQSTPSTSGWQVR